MLPARSSGEADIGMSSTASLAANRLTIGLPPAVMEWLRYEADVLRTPVATVAREKLTSLWKIRQPLVIEPHLPGRPRQ